MKLSQVLQSTTHKMHVCCRNAAKPYLRTEDVFRQAVPDDKVTWKQPLPAYNPPEYTAKSVLANPVWADSSDPTQYAFNTLDKRGINRKSYVSDYTLNAESMPLNPMGRTGLAGRGVLGKWGPNHAADAIVSRVQNGKLEYVSIKRRDNGFWAMPGGMVDNGEDAQTCSIREFTEEALNNKPDHRLAPLWQAGQLIYQGYVDDQRNTDNAWMETTVFNYHDIHTLLDDIQLKAGDDAADVKWITVEPGISIFPSHMHIIKLFADKHGFKI